MVKHLISRVATLMIETPINGRPLILLFAVVILFSGPPGCQATLGTYQAPDLPEMDTSIISSSSSTRIFLIDRREVRSDMDGIRVTPGMHSFMFEHPSGAAGEITFETQAAHEYEIQSYLKGESGWDPIDPIALKSEFFEIQAKVLDVATNENIPFEWRARKDLRPIDYTSGCSMPHGSLKWGG